MKSVEDSFLPGGSDQENLEAFSENYVRPLFGPERFILSKQTSDNGIDLHGEIKVGGQKVGFSFKIQLKSRGDADANTDGSFSKSLDTANLNYLWNQAVPAFYILYIHEEGAAYFQYLNPLLKELHTKNPEWENQKSHTVRFIQKLDATAVEKIYQIVYDLGVKHREMNYCLTTSLSAREGNERLLVDAQHNIVDDVEIGKWIERFGLYLCNEGKWLLVLERHSQGSRTATRSALYHFIVALANYYTGRLPEAMVELKPALSRRNELPVDLQGTILYFNAAVRFATGFYSKEEYDAQMATIPGSDRIEAQYLRLEELRLKYADGLVSDYEVAYSTFEEKANELMSTEGISENLRLLVQCELMRFEGCRNNTRYARAMANARAFEEALGLGSSGRKKVQELASRENFDWAKRMDDLKRLASSKGNPGAVFTAAFYEARVLLEFDVIRCLIGGGQRTHSSDAVMEQLLQNFESGYQYFRLHGFNDNMIAALSLRYELQSYLGRDTAETESELHALVDEGESKENKQKLKFLLEGGTAHRTYQRAIEEAHQAAEVARKEWQGLVEDMQALDEAEDKRVFPAESEHVIELFPIGRFIIPTYDVAEAFEVLGVKEEARAVFHTIWKLPAIPVANILNAPVQGEGYANGHCDDHGIESWRNIHRVRAEFHRKGLLRLNDA